MVLDCSKGKSAWCSTGKIIDDQNQKMTSNGNAKCVAYIKATGGLTLRNCAQKQVFVCEVWLIYFICQLIQCETPKHFSPFDKTTLFGLTLASLLTSSSFWFQMFAY